MRDGKKCFNLQFIKNHCEKLPSRHSVTLDETRKGFFFDSRKFVCARLALIFCQRWSTHSLSLLQSLRWCGEERASLTLAAQMQAVKLKGKRAWCCFERWMQAARMRKLEIQVCSRQFIYETQRDGISFQSKIHSPFVCVPVLTHPFFCISFLLLRNPFLSPRRKSRSSHRVQALTKNFSRNISLCSDCEWSPRDCRCNRKSNESCKHRLRYLNVVMMTAFQELLIQSHRASLFSLALSKVILRLRRKS